jgi:hypothetical protein
MRIAEPLFRLYGAQLRSGKHQESLALGALREF